MKHATQFYDIPAMRIEVWGRFDRNQHDMQLLCNAIRQCFSEFQPLLMVDHNFDKAELLVCLADFDFRADGRKILAGAHSILNPPLKSNGEVEPPEAASDAFLETEAKRIASKLEEIRLFANGFLVAREK